MFTLEELELLGAAVHQIPHPAYDALYAKIKRLRMVGQRVRFLNEAGEELIGRLDRFENDLDGKERAVVIRGGFGYLVDPQTELLGLEVE